MTRLGQKSIHYIKIYHLNQIIINSIEYSRCAERKSVWPNFSNFNTDGHSGSSTQLSQPENVYKQYQLLSMSHSSEKLRKIKKKFEFSQFKCRLFKPSFSVSLFHQIIVNGWIFYKMVKILKSLDRRHIVST